MPENLTLKNFEVLCERIKRHEDILTDQKLLTNALSPKSEKRILAQIGGFILKHFWGIVSGIGAAIQGKLFFTDWLCFLI